MLTIVDCILLITLINLILFIKIIVETIRLINWLIIVKVFDNTIIWTRFLFIDTLKLIVFNIKKSFRYFKSNIDFAIQIKKKFLNKNVWIKFRNITSKFLIKIVLRYSNLIKNKFYFDKFDVLKNILNVKTKILFFLTLTKV